MITYCKLSFTLKQCLSQCLRISLLAGSWLVIGCAPEEKTESATQPAIVEPAITSTNNTEDKDTSIAGQVAPDDFAFALYQQHTVTIKLDQLAAELHGDYYIIKVYDENQTFYLGTSQTLTPLELPISIPTNLSSIWIEVFTNDPASTVVSQVVIL